MLFDEISSKTKNIYYHFTMKIMNSEKFYINKYIIKMSNKVKDIDIKKWNILIFQ